VLGRCRGRADCEWRRCRQALTGAEDGDGPRIEDDGDGS
jgi:hypothetical protein